MVMPETATVTSKSMINIPAKIRRKYGIKEGTRVVFVEEEGQLILIPVPPIGELFGVDREHKDELLQAIREMEEEHRREAES
jgi:AbrB family looped-hinge helix DNA binding protein